MKNIFTVFRRELGSYFNSPIAYIFIVVFLLISCGLFMSEFFLISTADMRSYFMMLPVLICIFLPAVTMRLWSEDRRGNTLELLLTFPMNTGDIVAGKFLAGLIFYLIALISTFTLPIMLICIGKPDKGALLAQYIGAVFAGSFCLAIGIMVSGFCKDQIVSFILAMVACFGLFFIGMEFTAMSIDGWVPGLGTFIKNAAGMSQHFETFLKGVIDVRDVLYFLAGVLICLMLNSLWLESRLRPKAKSVFTLASVISIGIFMAFNLIFVDTPIGRIDLTEGRMHTISKASVEILKDLKTPVTLKLFISPQDKMPGGLKTLERDIRDRLDEFKVVSKGKLDYKVFNMQAANMMSNEQGSMEKSLQKKGIVPFQVQSIEADEMGVKLIYSAISISYKEKPEEIIPQISPRNLFELEYNIVSKIYKMTLDKMPSVALVAPYRISSMDPKLAMLLEQLGQGNQSSMREDSFQFTQQSMEYEGYRVSRIRLTEKEPIPEGTDTLVILDPVNMNDRQRYEVSRFLAGGGSVFMAVQNYEYDFQPSEMQGIQVIPREKHPEVNQLLSKWGLGVSTDFLMDKEAEIISIGGGSIMGLFQVSQPLKLPMQIKILPEQMNRDISITSYLPSLFYLWGTALDLDAEKFKSLGLKSVNLFTSSGSAWSVPAEAGQTSLPDITPPAANKLKKFPLCAMVEGQFTDAYDKSPVPAWPKEAPEAPGQPPKEEPSVTNTPVALKPGKLILTGCAMMFKKELFDKAGHMNLFLNSVDALTLGEKLVRVRSKAPIDRSLRKIAQGAKVFWKFFTVIFIPAAICIAGALRIFMRKRAKWNYLKAVS